MHRAMANLAAIGIGLAVSDEAGHASEKVRVMGLKERISAKEVVLGLMAGSKRNLLRMLAEEAARRLGRSVEDILGALQAREALGSTALGRGVALPHARLDGDDPPLMLFVQLRNAIDFEAKDDEPVDLVVLVLWPASSPDGFLPALAEVCRVLREPRALRRLRAAATPAEVAALLTAPDESHASS